MPAEAAQHPSGYGTPKPYTSHRPPLAFEATRPGGHHSHNQLLQVFAGGSRTDNNGLAGPNSPADAPRDHRLPSGFEDYEDDSYVSADRLPSLLKRQPPGASSGGGEPPPANPRAPRRGFRPSQPLLLSGEARPDHSLHTFTPSDVTALGQLNPSGIRTPLRQGRHFQPEVKSVALQPELYLESARSPAHEPRSSHHDQFSDYGPPNNVVPPYVKAILDSLNIVPGYSHAIPLSNGYSQTRHGYRDASSIYRPPAQAYRSGSFATDTPYSKLDLSNTGIGAYDALQQHLGPSAASGKSLIAAGLPSTSRRPPTPHAVRTSHANDLGAQLPVYTDGADTQRQPVEAEVRVPPAYYGDYRLTRFGDKTKAGAPAFVGDREPLQSPLQNPVLPRMPFGLLGYDPRSEYGTPKPVVRKVSLEKER